MEVVLDIVERLSASQARPDHRTTIEHAGIFSPEQAERLSQAGCLVSAQPYYHYTLADKYRQVGLGPDRASRMCPLGLLEKLGVRLALHSDFTMAPANPLLLAWCAVNRLTVEDEAGQSGTPDLCISPYTAIRGKLYSQNALVKYHFTQASPPPQLRCSAFNTKWDPLRLGKRQTWWSWTVIH